MPGGGPAGRPAPAGGPCLFSWAAEEPTLAATIETPRRIAERRRLGASMIVATWQLVSRPSLSTRKRGNRSMIAIAALRRRLTAHKPDETQNLTNSNRRKTVLRLAGRLHVEPLRLSGRNHRRCCSDGKGHDCKGKSDESQAARIRHRSDPYPNAYRSDVATRCMRLQWRPASNPVARCVCESVQGLCKACHHAFTNSRIPGDPDTKGRSMSALRDRFHQLAIFRSNISQASNDADRPRPHHRAWPDALSRLDRQQSSAENRRPFRTPNQSRLHSIRSGDKSCRFFPKCFIPADQMKGRRCQVHGVCRSRNRRPGATFYSGQHREHRDAFNRPGSGHSADRDFAVFCTGSEGYTARTAGLHTRCAALLPAAIGR